MKIAEAVDETWHREHGSGNLELPVSVIGALAFMAPPEPDHARTVDQLVSLTADEFADFSCVQWRIFIRARPDLVNRAWPLISMWLGERRLAEGDVSAAKCVADAALRAGQLQLTGTERRRETDLFGVLLEVLRSRSAKSARGQFYTPQCVADVMARLVGVPGEGERVLEPTAGTGGLFRAAAEAMRELGRDPSTVEWWAVDVDELAIACLTVNAVLWGLGNKVVLGVGNGLTDEWIPRALGERRETLGLAATVHSVTRLELLLRNAHQHADD
ncbi:N-6 DNA methylase [Lentzea sp. NPDC102401]|uniref:N-6 DNA methylase n=1 Tax=Lentzea sp. NPDC102401 TaxID=3364128 RepID=UPI003818029C